MTPVNSALDSLAGVLLSTNFVVGEWVGTLDTSKESQAKLASIANMAGLLGLTVILGKNLRSITARNLEDDLLVDAVHSSRAFTQDLYNSLWCVNSTVKDESLASWIATIGQSITILRSYYPQAPYSDESQLALNGLSELVTDALATPEAITPQLEFARSLCDYLNPVVSQSMITGASLDHHAGVMRKLLESLEGEWLQRQRFGNNPALLRLAGRARQVLNDLASADNAPKIIH